MIRFSTWGMSGTIATADARTEDFARERLDHWINEFDRCVNRFLSTSELSRINERGACDHVMSPTFELVLRASLEAADMTGGLCDPTILNALAALGYDRDYDELAGGTPDSGTTAAVPGVGAISYDPARHFLTLSPGVRLDFGATAKALLSDLLVRELAPCGGVLVEVGGDVAVDGEGPNGPFVIGLATSLNVTGDEPRISITRGGVATSSSTTRTWRHGERLVNHVIDPRTGDCALGSLVVATVAAPSCVIANALATAALLWDEDAAYYIAQAGYAARLVFRDGRVDVVGGWSRDEVAA